jgi:hypothetical protein
VKSYIKFTPHEYYSRDQIKEDEVGGAGSTHRRQEKCLEGLSCKT